MRYAEHPYVATIDPIVAEKGKADGTSRSQVLWRTLALGAGLAPHIFACAVSPFGNAFLSSQREARKCHEEAPSAVH
jgi:hypothetical protein